jgi:hypothetical protein
VPVKKTWKAVEQRVCKFFGTRRNPLSGGNGKHTRSDSLHPLLFIETKYRKAHTAVKLWRETKALADKEDKIPIVVLVEKGKRGLFFLIHSDDLVAVANQRQLAKKRDNGEA